MPYNPNPWWSGDLNTGILTLKSRVVSGKGATALLCGGFVGTTWAAIKKGAGHSKLMTTETQIQQNIRETARQAARSPAAWLLALTGFCLRLEYWPEGPLLGGVASEYIWFIFQETATFIPWCKVPHNSHQQTISVSLPKRISGTEDRILITFGS